MTGRMLRIELRRSVAPWIGVLILLFGSILLFALPGAWQLGTGAWDKQWNALARWLRFLLAVLAPPAVAAGGVLGVRDRRSGIEELLTSTPRPYGTRLVWSAIALAIGLAGAYLAIFLLGAVRVLGNTSYFHLDWLPVTAVGVLALVSAGWLGMGLARLLPSVLTPPLLMLLSIVVAVAVHVEGRYSTVSMLSPVFDGQPGAFSMIAPSANVGQLVWFTALASTGLLLVVARRKWARLFAVSPAVLGAAVALPLMPGPLAGAYVPDPVSSELVCAKGKPRVCVGRAHAAMLDEFVPPARESLALLAKLPSPPDAVEEVSDEDGRSPGAGVVPVDFELSGLSPSSPPSDFRLAVLSSGSAGACAMARAGPDSARTFAARAVAVAWLTGELRPLPHYLDETWELAQRHAEPAWRRLRALPPEEQRARVAAMRAAAIRCDGDLLTALETGGSR